MTELEAAQADLATARAALTAARERMVATNLEHVDNPLIRQIDAAFIDSEFEEEEPPEEE